MADFYIIKESTVSLVDGDDGGNRNLSALGGGGLISITLILFTDTLRM